MEIKEAAVATATKTGTEVGTKLGTGVILGLGVAFLSAYLMAGYLFFSGGQQSLLIEDAFTTCGTYTNPDGGMNVPLAGNGQIDRDCSTPESGDDVCFNNERPGCLLASPNPPKIALKFSDGSYRFDGTWYTDVSTMQNCLVLVKDNGTAPEPWRCVWDVSSPGCNQIPRFSYCRAASETDHHVAGFLESGYKWYYGVVGFSPEIEEWLKSEVRVFKTSPQRTIEATTE